MNSIDEQIRQALTAEDQKLIDQIDDEAGVFEMMGMILKGKQAWLTYYMWGMSVVIVILGIYFINQYLSATDIKTSLSWALGIITCLFAVTMIKIMGWQQMQKMELMREIKRLEMRVMLMAERKTEDDSQSD